VSWPSSGPGGLSREKRLPASPGLPVVSPGHDSASAHLGGGGLTSPLLGNANGRATKKVGTIEDKYWVPADEAERRAASKSGGEDGRPPLLFRTYKLKAAILHPYR
jgi:mixed-linked glucan synthase